MARLHRRSGVEGVGCPTPDCMYILAAHRVPFAGRWRLFVEAHWTEDERKLWRAEAELLDYGR